MDILKKHEIFEIETLDRIKNNKFLQSLVFGGGTMMRLCYDLNRYSADLDFWMIKKINAELYFKKLKKFLNEQYELTDACNKFNTLLFEIRSPDSPKRLKIEIRKKSARKNDYQEKIAFCRYSTKQVLLKVFTLQQMMKNKIEASLERKDIRDYFDIEFLLRQGLPLQVPRSKVSLLKKTIAGFKPKDFSVTLGSALGADVRRYYIKNKFDYLLKKIDFELSQK